MSGRPILNNNADAYIANVDKHGIEDDTRWIIDEGRFPVGCRVLDVGSGTGKLAFELGREADFYRTVHGIEISPKLASHAISHASLSNVNFINGDFLTWKMPADWSFDTVVMSFYLHHCDNHEANLKKAATLLPHGGRLYVFDRIAADQKALLEFKQFWNKEYQNAHEWEEKLPNLCYESSLIESAKRSELHFVRRVVCPHDKRPGTSRFPKVLMEFWRREPGCSFPAVALVSPAHRNQVDEIVSELALTGLAIKQRKVVPYTGDLIRQLYRHCPWKDRLVDFVAEKFPRAEATALVLEGDPATPQLLRQLTQFKKLKRDQWPSIRGSEVDGLRPMILPFHVSEPDEMQLLCNLLELEGAG